MDGCLLYWDSADVDGCLLYWVVQTRMAVYFLGVAQPGWLFALLEWWHNPDGCFLYRENTITQRSPIIIQRRPIIVQRRHIIPQRKLSYPNEGISFPNGVVQLANGTRNPCKEQINQRLSAKTCSNGSIWETAQILGFRA